VNFGNTSVLQPSTKEMNRRSSKVEKHIEKQFHKAGKQNFTADDAKKLYNSIAYEYLKSDNLEDILDAVDGRLINDSDTIDQEKVLQDTLSTYGIDL